MSSLLHEFFDRHAARSPDHIALEIPPGRDRPARVRLSYGELLAQSLAIARRLRPFVLGESVVALHLPRTSPLAYSALLGVLRAGAAFTAIDLTFPDQRVRDVIDDSCAVALITDDAGADRATRLGIDRARILNVEHPLDPACDEHETPPAWLLPSTLAYIIYTSGTTGRPKGVMVEHRAIANLVAGDVHEFRLSPPDRAAQGSSHAYDSSIEEIWLAFAAGATVVVLDDETVRAGPDLASWLDRERITVLCPPPTLLRTMGRRDTSRSLSALSLIYVGGEALTDDVASDWSEGRRLVNGYGPTECAVTAIRTDIHANAPIAIGRPVPGVRAWVLNDALQEVPADERGELCLGGAGLARGYWNAPELTSKKFVDHPSLGRLYRTGDLAHRSGDGTLYRHGRLDSQVKLRGYRIELEEIESHLARCTGVRAAACCIQSVGGRQTLVAFVVAADASAPPSADALRAALASNVPAYMVPAHVAIVDALPTTVGGKLNRSALPLVAIEANGDNADVEPPRDALEHLIETRVRRVTSRTSPISISDDFFGDLGGDSLRAAELVTALRDEPATAMLTVRDVYEAPTIRALADRARTTPAPSGSEESRSGAHSASGHGRHLIATAVQTAWLVTMLVAATAAGTLVVLPVLQWLVSRFTLTALVLMSPVLAAAAFTAYTITTVFVAVAVKTLLIGRYAARRAPVWSAFYVRHWIVQHTARLIPWDWLGGTVFQPMILRALGARVGTRFHAHRGVDLLDGGWDLLEIGDDVSLGQESEAHVVELEDGQIDVGPIAIGNGATLHVRAGLSPHTRMGDGAVLAALSHVPSGSAVPAGELWDGVPASPAGRAPARSQLSVRSREMTPLAFTIALIVAEATAGVWLLLPLGVLAIAAIAFTNITTSSFVSWMLSPTWTRTSILLALAAALVPAPLAVMWSAITLRLLGAVPIGVVPRWSWQYVRVWIKTALLTRAGNWLSGSLLWPIWLRASGMTIGRDCEISTIIDVVPEHISIGHTSFLADGIYLGGPRVHQGRVQLDHTHLGAGSFVGNHAVIGGGRQLADRVLIGVSTVASDDLMREGSSWFGHPPFALPRRALDGVDRRLTHEPSFIRYVNRLAWECGRFAIPIASFGLFVTWTAALASHGRGASTAALAFVVAPAVTIAVSAAACALILAMKWLLLGRVSPGEHILWSCWCSRWDFLFVAWGMIARPVLASLEGTLLLTWYVRAMGARIGRRVILGGGLAQVVDPDMLQIDDDATVQGLFQAHTFEDRVLKIDRVRIGRRANVSSGVVLLYGADIGEGASVTPHSVVMKREHLTAGQTYSGCPTRPMRRM